MKARDVMQTTLVTVPPDTPVRDAARLLLERGVSAVPVVDGQGRLLGILSEADLVRRDELGTERPRKWWLWFMADSTALAEDYARTHGTRAGDVMSTPVVTAGPDATLPEIVALMERNRVKRLPVVEGDRLVGIISRSDLVRALVSAPPGMPATEADHAIRRVLIEKLRDQPWATIQDSNVVVVGGVVHFWGGVSSEAERRALRTAAETIPGVRQVHDHTVLMRFAPGLMVS